MNIDNRTSFGCKLPSNIEVQLRKRIKDTGSMKRTYELLSEKLDDITKWGNPNSEIVYTTHPSTGKFRLGIKFRLEDGLRLSFPIVGIKGRNELAQFLSITEEKIETTEKSIIFLYKKYGLAFFNGYNKK